MTASPCASTSRTAWLAAILLFVAGTAAAAPGLPDLSGHLALGYAKRVNPGSPGGSLSMAAGMELPVRPALSLGVEVGFDLLGSQVFESGSLSAQLDQNVFEALALAHWTPPRGPLSRVSVGPGVFHARAGLTTAAPASFSELPVEETAPGMGVGLELGSRRESLVKAGFELGARAIWLERGTWTIALARLTVRF